ncbi:MAG: aminotransferase class I/II-fold pyridoxal phosphate-dependent enzyme [Clostridia bacterium]|nr:aminotransferase class I/II-fold pyridoxal phosphate-dependent enzyme [Clostridia bacterium]
MNTPICDFVNEYTNSKAERLHMPGHKGVPFLGFEAYDITEIDGADSLYEASGIIAESEKNAGSLFGCDTFYSAEGSSQCIKAMVHLAVLHAKSEGKAPLIAAGRNAHKAFMNAAALTDCDVMWLYSDEDESYLSCMITAQSLENSLEKAETKPTAVYITSPDYLGSTVDIKSISAVCNKHGILLLVDNAHGAYLKFLPQSLHPMDCGADICCDSAHKTLPVLTGGAYLHISKNADPFFAENAKASLVLYGSTSPSYLILQSLDKANEYINGGYREGLAEFCAETAEAKKFLADNGFELYGSEPLKITIGTKSCGYYGTDFADILKSKGILCEFSDKDFIVLMLTPENSGETLKKLADTLISIPKKERIRENPPAIPVLPSATSIRKAVFSPCETVDISNAKGRILAQANVACPPAVPVAVCGEIITEEAIKCFEYFGINQIKVVK